MDSGFVEASVVTSHRDSAQLCVALVFQQHFVSQPAETTFLSGDCPMFLSGDCPMFLSCDCPMFLSDDCPKLLSDNCLMFLSDYCPK